MHSYYDFDENTFHRHSVDLLASHGRKNILASIPQRDQNHARDIMRATEENYDKLGNLLSRIHQATKDDDHDEIFRL